MPFVTEEIWQDLAPRKAGESIMVQRMPEAREIDEALLGRFELTKEVVTAVRNVRKQKNILQKDPLTLRVIADENYPAEYAPVLQKMGNLSQIETTREKDPSAVGFLVKTTQYFVPMEGMIDIEAERKKLAGDWNTSKDSSPACKKSSRTKDSFRRLPRKSWPTNGPNRPTPKPRSPRFGNNWRP